MHPTQNITQVRLLKPLPWQPSPVVLIKLKLLLLSTTLVMTYLLTSKELLIGEPELKAGRTTEATISLIKTLELDTMKKSP